MESAMDRAKRKTEEYRASLGLPQWTDQERDNLKRDDEARRRRAAFHVVSTR